MFFKLDSFALIGIDAIRVTIEVHISRGLPGCIIVGLPGKAVNESRLRVRSAVLNSGYEFPIKKITVNLSPAYIKKEGSFYDLPIALSILAVSGQINSRIFCQSCFVGELSLNGKINAVRGVISMAEKASTLGKKNLFVPYDIACQASFIPGVNIIACRELKDAVAALEDSKKLKKFIYIEKKDARDPNRETEFNLDLSDVKGQLKAKRALEIAAAGMHNIMMIGPPGSGKTMLARRAVSVMADLDLKECIEVTKIHSLSKSYTGDLLKKRPFRNPHHTISRMSLIGGGTSPRPGEISLSHKGILFLDEFSQFSRLLIEDLRQPLEDKKITITRNNLSFCFPCDFMMIVAVNPCFCGYLGDDSRKCICSVREIKKFWKNLSGPIIDRIDMRVIAARLKEESFIKTEGGESSKEVKKRVKKAVLIQKKRFAAKQIDYNSGANIIHINKWLSADKNLRDLIHMISKRYRLTARGMVSILKVSRTIADLEESTEICEQHVIEAAAYRTGFYQDPGSPGGGS